MSRVTRRKLKQVQFSTEYRSMDFGGSRSSNFDLEFRIIMERAFGLARVVILRWHSQFEHSNSQIPAMCIYTTTVVNLSNWFCEAQKRRGDTKDRVQSC